MSGRTGTLVALCTLLWLGALGTVALHAPIRTESKGPDFDHYQPPRILTNSELGLDRPDGRVILIGDIHGMNGSLHELLDKLSYNPAHDTLVPTGDLLTRAGDAGGRAVLAFLAARGARAVRGNQDQPVVRWRAWQEWVAGLDERGRPLGGDAAFAASVDDGAFNDEADYGEVDDDEVDDADDAEESMKTMTGAEWLRRLDASWARWAGDRDRWIKHERKQGPRAWWARVPKEWRKTLFDDAYLIARDMSPAEAAYLRALPAVLHLPDLHTFVAHAGLLPYDPRRSTYDRRQPLARAPAKADVEQQRVVQERGLLRSVPQNADPWTPLHMRAVRRDGSLTKSAAKGTYWADLWTGTMARCAGFDASPPPARMRERGPLPCLGSAIVYGHTASFGLDVRRWSYGLDTGCVYGRRLTAMVLDAHSLIKRPRDRLAGEVVYGGGGDGQVLLSDNDGDSEDLRERTTTTPEWVPFGERGSARLVSVRCPRPQHITEDYNDEL